MGSVTVTLAEPVAESQGSVAVSAPVPTSGSWGKNLWDPDVWLRASGGKDPSTVADCHLLNGPRLLPPSPWPKTAPGHPPAGGRRLSSSRCWFSSTGLCPCLVVHSASTRPFARSRHRQPPGHGELTQPRGAGRHRGRCAARRPSPAVRRGRRLRAGGVGPDRRTTSLAGRLARPGRA